MECKVDWIPLGDLVHFESGGTPSKKSQTYWNGNIPWISAKTLIGDSVDTSNLCITSEGLKAGSRLAREGSLLLLTRGSGLFKHIPLAMTAKDVAYNQDIKCLTSKRANISNRYIFFALRSLEPNIVAMLETTGIGAGKLSTDRLKTLQVPVLDSESRLKVERFFEAVFQKIALNTKLNGYLEELLLARFKALIPSDNWSEGRADSFFEIGIGKTPPRKETEWFANSRSGNYVWLSIKDMGTPGAYSLDSAEYLTHAAVKQKNIRQVPEGSVLLSFKLTVGRVKIAACDMTTNEAIAYFNSNDKKQLAYIYPYLLTYDYNKLGSTSSIATAVNSKTIKTMPIAMPDNNELSSFYTATKPLYEQMLNIAKENIALASLRDALLPKLMSGEIDVSKIDAAGLNSHLA